jgi:hypothetical protein
MARETTQELMVRMQIAEHMVPSGYAIRHVRTGGEYIVHGHALRVGDLTPMVSYSPFLGTVVFSRAVDDVQAKFVRIDGMEWKSLHSMKAAKEGS